MNYDIIGDVHGHVGKLEALLAILGYRDHAGAWRHPDRAAIFVGDLIDRGPGQLRTLELVRRMVDAGSARAVMGNHEFNAIAYATPDPGRPGEHLRTRSGPRGDKHRHQHRAFLSELGEDTAAHKEWVRWFLQLPLWIEEASFRVVHACWSQNDIDIAAQALGAPHLTEGALPAACDKASALGSAIEVLLKGAEVRLPDDLSFKDKDGHARREIRTRWWDPSARTYATAYIGPPGVTMPSGDLPTSVLIAPPDRPTFIGHYWFDPTTAPSPATDRVACVDYSAGKGGPLVAYRFDGEPVLSPAKFVAV